MVRGIAAEVVVFICRTEKSGHCDGSKFPSWDLCLVSAAERCLSPRRGEFQRTADHRRHKSNRKRCVSQALTFTSGILLLSIEAVGADITRLDPDWLDQVIESVITQAGEILDAADFIEHCLITFAVRICIFFQIFFCIFSFAFQDHLFWWSDPARIWNGRSSGIYIRRAAEDTPVWRGLLWLRSDTGTRLSHEAVYRGRWSRRSEAAFVFDQGMYRDQLHAGDQFSLTLVCRHKGTRPGRCIFNERTGERNAGFIGISDSMCDTGVWDTGYDIRIYSFPLSCFASSAPQL